VGRLPTYGEAVERNQLGLEVLKTTEGDVAGGAFNLNGVEWLVTVVPTERPGFTYRPRSIADWDGPTIWQSLYLNWVPSAA
jgi:hypothetical protein